ncbi:hypothetical protein AB6D76_13205 [Vibrio splendidus]|uniref:hypothetical protein n=1 Tax=Vibrio crassostreae TaxID=246167 RepID=UPI001B31055A|nr:hypothetical protein [Vibrio crassostreae]
MEKKVVKGCQVDTGCENSLVDSDIVLKAVEAAQNVIDQYANNSKLSVVGIDITDAVLERDKSVTLKECGTHTVCLETEPYCEFGESEDGKHKWKACGTKQKCKVVAKLCL